MHKSIPLDPERVLLDVELSNGSELIRLMCEKVLTAEGVSSEETVDSLYARISERSAHRTLMTTNGALCINVRIDGMEGVRVCFLVV